MYPWFNIGRPEGQIRILLAVILIVLGTHSNWLVFSLGLILLYTGVNHHCPVYFAFKINETKYNGMGYPRGFIG